jgi:Icc-related predicted phosphoesterase
MKVNIGFISDTHTKHNEWYDNLSYNHWGWELKQKWDDLDILIFSGDCSMDGSIYQVDTFMNWFNLQPGQKVMISGNHDFLFDTNYKAYTEIGKSRHKSRISKSGELEKLLNQYKNIHYLNDSGINLFGLNIWGSPITPWFHDWAFNRERGDDIKKHWDLIPANTDILVTHGPPYKQGDLLCNKFKRDGEDPNVGCIDLLNRIKEIKPKISVFGHIHEAYGITEDEHTKYINASVLNENYKPVNAPIFITLDI